MRKIESKNLLELQKLTRFRRAILSSELTKIRLRVTQKEEEIASLKKRDATAAAAEELIANERWRRWTLIELKRLNSEHALLRMEHDQIVRTVGRAVAEDEVVDRLRTAAQVEESIEVRRRAEQDVSHFLPNNVGDQDV